MYSITVEKTYNSLFDISQMSIKRDWMDLTSEGHAYRCFPVTQANVIGYSLSCKEDIEFLWDGVTDQTGDHVEIFNPKSAYSGRGQSSISMDTGLIFRTDSDVSILAINPVNYFSDEFETMSSLITTSFYNNPLPLALRAKIANKKVVIKAGTPVATIIPISLTNLNNTVISIVDYQDIDNKRMKANMSYGEAAQAINSSGEWTDWYRNAINEKEESLGSHEVKTLRLKVIDNTNGGII
jgi:hypothetical protein